MRIYHFHTLVQQKKKSSITSPQCQEKCHHQPRSHLCTGMLPSQAASQHPETVTRHLFGWLHDSLVHTCPLLLFVLSDLDLISMALCFVFLSSYTGLDFVFMEFALFGFFAVVSILLPCISSVWHDRMFLALCFFSSNIYLISHYHCCSFQSVCHSIVTVLFLPIILVWYLSTHMYMYSIVL